MKDAFYFPHFCNARNDRKIKRMTKELGVEGYGIYFMVLETLREQEGFKYPMDDIDLLADDFKTSEQKLKTVISKYDLFRVDEEKNFFSIKFIEYLKPYLSRKARNKINGIKGNLIRYNYASKEDLENLTDAEIIELNDNKESLIPMLTMVKTNVSGGESGGDHDFSQSKVNKRKERKGKENAESIGLFINSLKQQFEIANLGATDTTNIINWCKELDLDPKGEYDKSTYLQGKVEGYSKPTIRMFYKKDTYIKMANGEYRNRENTKTEGTINYDKVVF